MKDKEFWERCGWEYMGVTNSATSGLVYAPRETWRCKTGEYKNRKNELIPLYHTFYGEHKGECPPSDLNNLFKYAVPKKTRKIVLEPNAWITDTGEIVGWGCVIELENNPNNFEGDGDSPAKSLRQAIEQLFEEAQDE